MERPSSPSPSSSPRASLTSPLIPSVPGVATSQSNVNLGNIGTATAPHARMPGTGDSERQGESNFSSMDLSQIHAALTNFSENVSNDEAHLKVRQIITIQSLLRNFSFRLEMEPRKARVLGAGLANHSIPIGPQATPGTQQDHADLATRAAGVFEDRSINQHLVTLKDSLRDQAGIDDNGSVLLLRELELEHFDDLKNPRTLSQAMAKCEKLLAEAEEREGVNALELLLGDVEKSTTEFLNDLMNNGNNGASKD